MAKSELVCLTVWLEKNLLKKLNYIAAFDGRSTNEECELMIREWVRAFEEVDGEIGMRMDNVASEKK